MARLGRGQPFAPKLARPVIGANGASSVSAIRIVGSSSASDAMSFNMRAGYGYAACWAQTTIIDLSTPSVADSLSNTWTRMVGGSPSSANASIFTTICVNPGLATITLSVNVNTTWIWQVIEIAPARLGIGIRDIVAVDTRTGSATSAATTSHVCAGGGGLNTNPFTTVVACGAFNGTSGGPTTCDITQYAMWSGGMSNFMTMTRYSGAALSGEIPAFTSQSSTSTFGCCVSFYSYGGDGAVAVAGLPTIANTGSWSGAAPRTTPKVIAY